MMKKIFLIISAIILVGCSPVEGNNQQPEYNTKYQIILNSGSCFVYTFRDEKTGVWYFSSSKGITPRLNSDGTLYVEE